MRNIRIKLINNSKITNYWKIKYLNYKHLHYFWVIANTGSIVRASEQLHLTPQTLSGQLSKLEDDFGMLLFTRSGRNLVLNESGEFVFGYANEIFTLGAELEDTVHNFP